MRMSKATTATMISIVGAATATLVGIARPPRATSPMTLWAMRTSTNMAVGVPFLNTAPFGSRTLPSWAGHLTATVIGFGFLRGAGLGWTMRLGVLLRSTTAAGLPSAASGVGYR